MRADEIGRATVRRRRGAARGLLGALVLAVAGCGGGGYGGDSTGARAPDVRSATMSAGRAFHTVTALGNGDLLIAGGTGTGGTPLPSCDVLDASAVGTATPVVACGAMSVARTRHTATLLLSGHVVAIGGSASATTEEFTPDAATPALGTWTASAFALLPTPRSRHAAALLLDGRVLVCGGVDAGATTLSSCALYVGAGLPFSPATSMNVARRDATATTLPDGRVLVVGGYDAAGVPLASAEVYAPGPNTWTLVGSLSVARALHAATLLNATDGDPTNDRVLVTGGAGAGGGGVRAAELFDPILNAFSAGGNLEGPGVFDHAAVLLANGQAAVVGGFTDGGGVAPADPVRETVVYRYGSGLGVGAQDVPGRRGGVRAGVVASTGPAGSDVVVVGGLDQGGTPRAEVWILAIDDEAKALADTLSDADALALAVFATAFHVFTDQLTGSGDVDVHLVDDPVRGRRLTGTVGNFSVDLEVDAGSVVGDVEGKPYVLAVDADYVSAPDFVVDFRPSSVVDGDMDTAAEDFDFDVHRDATTYHGYVTGEDAEAHLRVDTLGDHTDATVSYMDVYLLW